MTDPALPILSAAELRSLAEAQAGPACPACAAIRAPGWEALSTTLDREALRRVATLRAPGDEDPTLAEYHPSGTNGWSADAPLAPAWRDRSACCCPSCRSV